MITLLFLAFILFTAVAMWASQEYRKDLMMWSARGMVITGVLIILVAMVDMVDLFLI